MSISIKTIAREVGVTHGTVSRALKGDPRVRPETAEKIREAARRLGYTPSRTARNLRNQRTGTLGIAVSYFSDPFYSEVIEGIYEAMVGEDYSIFLAGAYDPDTDKQARLVRLIQEQQVDGLLVHLPTLDGPLSELLTRIPCVLINCTFPEFPYSVSNDDFGGATSCVQHLIVLGHRRIAYLGNALGGTTENVRLAAYRQTMADAELQEDVLQAEDGRMGSAGPALREWLREAKGTAVFCYNDLLAVGALQACREAGLRVPEDISVVGFDDVEVSRFVTPSLTTYAQPKFELGFQAAKMMLHRLRHPAEIVRPVWLSGQLVRRESSARVPS